jgi:hypothetical protein
VLENVSAPWFLCYMSTSARDVPGCVSVWIWIININKWASIVFRAAVSASELNLNSSMQLVLVDCTRGRALITQCTAAYFPQNSNTYDGRVKSLASDRLSTTAPKPQVVAFGLPKTQNSILETDVMRGEMNEVIPPVVPHELSFMRLMQCCELLVVGECLFS